MSAGTSSFWWTSKEPHRPQPRFTEELNEAPVLEALPEVEAEVRRRQRAGPDLDWPVEGEVEFGLRFMVEGRRLYEAEVGLQRPWPLGRNRVCGMCLVTWPPGGSAARLCATYTWLRGLRAWSPEHTRKVIKIKVIIYLSLFYLSTFVLFFYLLIQTCRTYRSNRTFITDLWDCIGLYGTKGFRNTFRYHYNARNILFPFTF